MNCQELFFNLFAIYVVPKSVGDTWVSYPWNIPYDEQTATISLADMGFKKEGGKDAFSNFIDALNTCTRLTSYDGGTTELNNLIYCDEGMTAAGKPKVTSAGTIFDNTVKCTAVYPTHTDLQALARMMNAPHDLVLVSDNNDFFLLRSPEEGYRCEVVQNLGNAWRHDVSFTVQNCHGLQLIMTE